MDNALQVLAAAPMRAVRPLMLRNIYANPEKELVRIRNNGRLVQIAHGTYLVKPDTIGAEQQWIPPFEEAAMAYATAQYGDRVPILIGIGAARFHHAIARAIGVTVIAVPEQHRPVVLRTGGRIVFTTTTNMDQIDARPERTSLGTMLVATPEQNLIDLIERPQLGDMPEQATEAAEVLVASIDRDRLNLLIERLPKAAQRRVKTWLERFGK